MPLHRLPLRATRARRGGAFLAITAAATLVACTTAQPPANTPLPTPAVKGSPAAPGSGAKPSPSPSPAASPSPSPSPSPAPR